MPAAVRAGPCTVGSHQVCNAMHVSIPEGVAPRMECALLRSFTMRALLCAAPFYSEVASYGPTLSFGARGTFGSLE